MSTHTSEPSAAAAATAADRSEYPSELLLRERELIKIRRGRAGIADGGPADGLPPDTVGVAFSGGGIRSATFCLGFAQALAREDLLRRVDYLSSVSGGGYLASCLGALIARRGVEDARQQLGTDRSPLLAWLRENGRYLSPNGSGDDVLGGVVLLRNTLAVQAVLLLAALALLSATVGVSIITQLALGASAPAYWSPYCCAVAGVLAFAALPRACAYWMVPAGGATPPALAWREIAAAALVGLPLAAAAAHLGLSVWSVLVTAAVPPVVLWRARADLLRHWKKAEEATQQVAGARLTRDHRVRNLLSAALARVAWVTVPLLVLAVLDSLGAALYRHHQDIRLWNRLVTLVVWLAIIWLLRRLAKRAPRANGRAHVSVPIEAVAAAAAAIVIGGALVVISAAVHAVTWEALFIPGPATGWKRGLSLALLIGIGTGLSCAVRGMIRFANDSSDQALYGARLVRAYLGASNEVRQHSPNGARVTDPMDGDDLTLAEYTPERHGGPLHLINVTLNETVAGESQIEHRDRKGLALAAGPAGLSAGVRHHALWGGTLQSRDPTVVVPIPHPPNTGRYHALADGIIGQAPDGRVTYGSHPVEGLSLGRWAAISGAAVAPGLGSRTSLAVSALLTFFNVRLGYWWDTHVEPSTRADRVDPASHLGEWLARQFPVQTHLVYELLSRFHGPNRRRWYLSDGGHFENTAAYELIRRRVPFIIVCDCGQDADFAFTDVANLVRKARTDFRVEIRFLDRDALDQTVDPALRPYLGTPADFRPWQARRRAAGTDRRAYAMLAEVRDIGLPPTEAPHARILFVKPVLCGSEPEDILNYAGANPDFPQQSTADQYFDEAQWESYRRLGEEIGLALLAPAGSQRAWAPRQSMAADAPRAAAAA